MAVTGKGIVDLIINNGNVDKIRKVKTFASGNMNDYTSGRIVIASGASATIGLGGITLIQFFYIVSVDSSGNAKSVTITHNDSINTPPTGDRDLYGGVTELLWTASENAALGYIKLTAQADGTDTIIDYVIGGT